MRRCIELARLGAGHVSPNPLVGALVVHNGRIVGEGWHRRYGEAHAEVNAIVAVRPEDRRLIAGATLYCSLEPCFHHGKTPPCVDLVLRENIQRVVIATTDPNPLVAGQSVAKLRAAGVEVLTDVLREEALDLNRPFFKWIGTGRPYVVLKWAQSRDRFLGRAGERTPVSGPAALRLVHRWRAECDAILVGAGTALTDNPRLDTRLFPGKNPVRLVFDRKGIIPAGHHLLDDTTATWVFGPERPGEWQQTRFWPGEAKDAAARAIDALAAARKQTLLVEGGARTLRAYFDAGLWDEVRVLENRRMLRHGIAAPDLPASARLVETTGLGEDVFFRYVKEDAPPAGL